MNSCYHDLKSLNFFLEEILFFSIFFGILGIFKLKIIKKLICKYQKIVFIVNDFQAYLCKNCDMWHHHSHCM